MSHKKKEQLKISPRELACLRLFARGCNAKQTARELSLQTATVWSYLHRLKRKFETPCLQDVLNKARERSLL